jgi:hypothetical protein
MGHRISQYLSKTNVQLGASYHTGQISNTKYQEGYQAAAQYINASPDEIGNSFSLHTKNMSANAGQYLVLQQRSFS